MMDGGASFAVKFLAAAAASAGGSAVATEVITRSERIILGVPQSWFLAAVVGALIGVVFLKDIDAGRISSGATGALAVRWSTMLLRVAFLGGFVLAFALLASWIVVALTVLAPGIKEAGVVFSGLSGAVIRPMLPHYLAGLQKFTDRFAGRGGQA
jgi:hypothetical protein